MDLIYIRAIFVFYLYLDEENKYETNIWFIYKEKLNVTGRDIMGVKSYSNPKALDDW